MCATIYFGPLAWIFGHSERDAIVLCAPKQGKIFGELNLSVSNNPDCHDFLILAILLKKHQAQNTWLIKFTLLFVENLFNSTVLERKSDPFHSFWINQD